MNFFVPYAESRADAERFWAMMRTRMAEEYDLRTTTRRIFALATDSGAIEVGDGTPRADYEDVVMAILECAEIDDIYFVVTYHHDALQDPPYSLCLDDKWRVVNFEDGARV